ncbi:hypothetical protein GOODEAATRI_004604 [Goodea atripinnis]|uniref:Uncharacterized protein n=1 Tax=Goodea atripinnis TaxID=208336 RepID=A0ABV0N802_9TELE
MNENTGYTDSISFYLTLHMIDDRMASWIQLNFMSFCQQKTSARFVSLLTGPSGRPRGRERLVERWGLICGQSSATPLSPSKLCFYLGNGATGSPQLSPFLAVPEEG